MTEAEATSSEKPEKYEGAIDWSSLLDAANDPELAELLQSPVDSAIAILKTGREVQKLSIIRTLSDLMENDGDQVVEKVMPLVQQMLADEYSNLDMQCEAAISYKNIYRNSKLTLQFP
ncbi:unnamed protein product [Gongylonema pulchrum]|uniref:HEAT repeat domain-containing protein n=1 Tax=Gongylonema pulchrum TaxID=637853 RepID=A0A183CY48_9BILA|nr:unnamed protein product [Gongylonema pulchrum]